MNDDLDPHKAKMKAVDHFFAAFMIAIVMAGIFALLAIGGSS